MKYKKDEHVYVIYRSQVCNATILDWNIEKPHRGPAEIRYLVHLSYRPDRKKEVWKEEDLWVDGLSVMRQGLHADEKEVRNPVGGKMEGEEHAEVPAREPEAAGKEPEARTGDAGAEPRSALEGRIYVHSVFVSRCWVRPRNLELWEGHLVEAERWLEDQAEAHGKKVTFVNGWTGFDGMPIHWRRSGGFGRVAEQMAFLERVLSLSGLRSIDGIARLAEEHGCDRHALFVMVDEPGRSFAMCCSESPFLGHAVVFHRESHWYRYMLSEHLTLLTLFFFGAQSLYADGCAPDNELKQRVRARWPNDVMTGSDKPLAELTISPYTAAKVGWMEEKDVWADKGTA